MSAVQAISAHEAAGAYSLQQSQILNVFVLYSYIFYVKRLLFCLG